MSLESITSAVEEFDLGAILPDLAGFLSNLQTMYRIALIVGPIVILVLGLWYLFLPPKNVGSRAGFLTYYAIGSPAAWKFTQRMAGIIWTALGLILVIIMGIHCGSLPEDMSEAAHLTLSCLTWQVLLAAIFRLVISVLPAVFFDRAGNRRKWSKK